MTTSRRALSIGLVFAFSSAACAGTARHDDNSAWEAKVGSNFVGNGEEDTGGVPGRETVLPFNWVGVRHDLGINPNRPRSSNCTCLSIEVGSPGEPRFVWRGTRPSIEGNNLAVAISSAGLDCPGGASNPGDRRPSISGVFRDKGDVVVEIEEALSDRPIATGAIIAPPDANGRIFFRPKLRHLPYAHPDSTGHLCRVK